MKLIGIIGGMSCESSALYYAWLNQGVRRRLGGLHSAQLLLWSVDFHEIEKMQSAGDWTAAGETLAEIAARLECAGAELVLLATNTMHRVADRIESTLSVPFLHIADATGQALVADGKMRPGLMATGYTMRETFYRERLSERFGLDVLVPQDRDFDDTHSIIYEELCLGIVREESRARYVEIADRLVKRGADSIILGCTEVSMLLGRSNTSVPVFDTAQIHVARALDLAIGQSQLGTAA